MKLKYAFKTMNVMDEQIAIPQQGDQSFQGAIRVNGTAADILELLKTDTTEDELLAAMRKQYDASDAQLTESIRLVLDALRQEGLLEE